MQMPANLTLPHWLAPYLGAVTTQGNRIAARLLARCVLSLADLLFSFCMRSVLAILQMVDAITGKVISSMVVVLALKVPCNT